MTKKTKAILIGLAVMDATAEVLGGIFMYRKYKEYKDTMKNLRDQLHSEQSTSLRLAQDLGNIRAERDELRKKVTMLTKEEEA